MAPMIAEQTIRSAETINPLIEKYWGFVYITPEIAKLWLQYNIRNRKVNRFEVNKCKRLLVTGEWRDDYSVPIAFSDCRLHDGQHRLLAIVESGIAAVSRLLTGQPDDAFAWYDGQRRRNLADRTEFDVDQTKNKHISAIVSSYVEQLYNGGNPVQGGLTAPAAMEVFEKHKEAIVFASEFMGRSQVGITNATVCGVMGQLYERSMEYAYEFATELLTKGSEVKNAAILREYLIKNGKSGSGRHGRRELWFRCVYACYNYWKGKEIRALRRCDWNGVAPKAQVAKE